MCNIESQTNWYLLSHVIINRLQLHFLQFEISLQIFFYVSTPIIFCMSKYSYTQDLLHSTVLAVHQIASTTDINYAPSIMRMMSPQDYLATHFSAQSAPTTTTFSNGGYPRPQFKTDSRRRSTGSGRPGITRRPSLQLGPGCGYRSTLEGKNNAYSPQRKYILLYIATVFRYGRIDNCLQ